MPPKFLVTPMLSLRGRARLLCEPFIRQKRDDAPESIWDFAARRIGKEAADTLVSSMVTGIFGGDARQLSLEHCFPRMAEMEREHGGLVKAMLAKRKEGSGGGPAGPGGVLTSFKSGIGRLAERAAETLGDRVRLGHKAVSVAPSNGGYRIATENGETVTAESVVLAMPSYAGASVVSGLDEAMAKTLASIAYAHISVVCTAYRRENVGHDVDGFGFLVPRTQNKRTLGCIWTSAIFPHNVPDGWVLLRTLYGGYLDPEAIELSDAELIGYVKQEIHPLLRIDNDPEVVRIYRHRNGIPQYLLNHGEILAELDAAEARHRGFALVGNAYRGVSLNDCVVAAHKAAEKVLGDVG